MAEKIVSPGVFSKEIDASFLPAAVGDIGACIVGPTVKGPALVPTVVDSYQEYQAKFGDVFKSGSGYHQYLTSITAKNYLQHSSPLTVCRVMGAGYSHASASIADGVVDVEYIAPVVAAKAAGSLTVDDASTLGEGETFTLIDTAGTSHVFTFRTGNDDYDNNEVGISTCKGASNEGACSDQIVLAINNVAGVASTCAATITAIGDNALVNLEQDVVGLAGNTAIAETATGLSKVDFADGKDTVAEVLAAGGALGDIAFKLHTLSHGTILNSNGPVGSNQLLESGSSNNLRWEISSRQPKKGTFTLQIRRGDDTSRKKQILETWNGCSLDPNAGNYVGKKIGDQYITLAGTAAEPYLEFTGDYPNKSQYVRVASVRDIPDYLDENGNVKGSPTQAALNSGSIPALGSGSAYGAFAGAEDGTINHPLGLYDSIAADNTQGFDLGNAPEANQYLTALNLLANADEYDFNLLLIPGICRGLDDHTAIVTKAIDICENRGDAFVIIDPVGYDENSVRTVTDQGKAVDSNFAAMYWPWLQVTDPQVGKNVWVPPSVAMAGIYANNDRVAAPWFAPAGLNRGVISTAVQAKRKLTLGNRDQLYDSNINPIATFPAEGVCVWGQKTLQKKSSALDRVNVRRLMIKVKKFISASSRFLVFEQNNAKTRGAFLAIANPFLLEIKEKSGLNAFNVVMDQTNNTPDIVDRNILYGQIFVQPTKTAEFIILDFTIQPTGASFPE